MLQAKLVVVGGDAKSKEVRLRLPAIIGRGREATLTVPHALISRLHCQITERDGRLFVRDLGSLNGTFIDNFRIEGEQPLMPDQLLTLGTITFRACYELGATTNDSVSETEPPLAGDKLNLFPAHSAEQRSLAKTVAVPSEVPVQHRNEVAPRPPSPERIAAAAIAAGASPAPASAPQPFHTVETWRVDTTKKVPVPNADLPTAIPTSASSGALAEGNRTPAALPAMVPDLPASSLQASDSLGPIRIDTDDPLAAEKSICVEALENLPCDAAAISFDGPIVIGDDTATPPSGVSSVHVLAGEEQSAPVDGQDRALVSFLKKMPR